MDVLKANKRFVGLVSWFLKQNGFQRSCRAFEVECALQGLGREEYESISEARKDFEIVIDVLNGAGKENVSHPGTTKSHRERDPGIVVAKKEKLSPLLVREKKKSFRSAPKTTQQPPKPSGNTPLQVRLRKLVGVDLRSIAGEKAGMNTVVHDELPVGSDEIDDDSREQKAENPTSGEDRCVKSCPREEKKSTMGNGDCDAVEEDEPQLTSADPFRKYIFTKSMIPSEEELYSKDLRSMEAKKMVKRAGRNWIHGIRLRECLVPSHEHRPDALCHSILRKAFQNGLETSFSTKGHRDLICGMSFSHEDHHPHAKVGCTPTFTFCTAAYDDRVRVWKYDDSRARNGVPCCESVYTFRELQSITAVTMDTLHQDVFAACSYKNKVLLHDIVRYESKWEGMHDEGDEYGEFLSMHYDPKKSSMWVGTTKGQLCTFDTRDKSRMPRMKIPVNDIFGKSKSRSRKELPVTGIESFEDGRWITVCHGGSLLVFDQRNMEKPFNRISGIHRLHSGSQPRRVFGTSAKGWIHELDLLSSTAPKTGRRYQCNLPSIDGSTFLPSFDLCCEDRFLVAPCADKKLMIYDTNNPTGFDSNPILVDCGAMCDDIRSEIVSLRCFPSLSLHYPQGPAFLVGCEDGDMCILSL